MFTLANIRIGLKKGIRESITEAVLSGFLVMKVMTMIGIMIRNTTGIDICWASWSVLARAPIPA